jgi:hypothetical protein
MLPLAVKAILEEENSNGFRIRILNTFILSIIKSKLKEIYLNECFIMNYNLFSLLIE